MAGGADWYALCERETGSVVVGESPEEDRYQVLAGPFPGRRTAGMWIEDHHPDHRCTAPVSGPHGNAALSADGEEWLAVCSQMTHEVELVQKAPPSGYLVLLVNNFQPTLHPDSTTARNWTDSVCPAWRCDSMGRCMTDPTANDPGAASGGWTAGSLTSVTLDSDATAAPQTSRAISVAGPGRADLSPLIDTATAAAMSCAYPAALASADHMTNFDPQHPWLIANHDTIRQLSARQRATEQSVWQASSALQSGELKHARRLAGEAADTAVTCQTRAVSELLHGIDTAIEQTRAARNAKRSQAASALLPGLIDLAGLISGAEAGTVEFNTANVSAVGSSLMPSSLDLCAFQLEYRDPAAMVPTCTCSGYVYDVGQFRCVR